MSLLSRLWGGRRGHRRCLWRSPISMWRSCMIAAWFVWRCYLRGSQHAQNCFSSASRRITQSRA
jgi:hypothetical protein